MLGRRRARAALGLAVIAGLVMTAPAEAAWRDLSKVKNWIVYYSNKAAPEAFDPYDLLVLDSRHHPPLQPLGNRGKILLGYISLGEVEKYRAHYQAVEKQGLLMEQNPNWPASRYVDIRDPRWFRRVLETLVPDILHRGFHGIFMDTLDNAAHLERLDPKRFRGMTEAAVRLVKAIRRHYPTILIVMNRGYELLPKVAGDIDAVLGESVYTTYDFNARVYRRVPADEYKQQVTWLKAARRRNPRLRILTLDYWAPGDRTTIARIYEIQRRNGFLPHVSVIKLDRIIPEPAK